MNLLLPYDKKYIKTSYQSLIGEQEESHFNVRRRLNRHLLIIDSLRESIKYEAMRIRGCFMPSIQETLFAFNTRDRFMPSIQETVLCLLYGNFIVIMVKLENKHSKSKETIYETKRNESFKY